MFEIIIYGLIKLRNIFRLKDKACVISVHGDCGGINNRVRMRQSSISDASLDSSSSDESSNNNYDMIWKEFKVFCAREACKLCAHINDLQRRSLKELLAVTTERLSTVMALRPSRFRYLQENEEFSLIRNSLHSTVYKLLRIVQKIFCRTVPNEDKELFSTLNELEFRISRTWSMSRSQFIERVIFPDLLTHFLKGNYQETCKQATGRLYGKSGKSKTLY